MISDVFSNLKDTVILASRPSETSQNSPHPLPAVSSSSNPASLQNSSPLINSQQQTISAISVRNCHEQSSSQYSNLSFHSHFFSDLDILNSSKWKWDVTILLLLFFLPLSQRHLSFALFYKTAIYSKILCHLVIYLRHLYFFSGLLFWLSSISKYM